MRALIDADNVAMAAAWTAEDESEEIAISRANTFIESILFDVGATEFELWLSGGNNFRYNVYPEYKANRISQARPKWEKQVKRFFETEWHAHYTEAIEADDMLGIRQREDTIICHLDKDLNQIAGHHFNWELRRLGVVIREKSIYTLTQEEADYWFFYQLLVGDTTDNIKGIPGIGPKKAAGILYGCETNQERYEAVADRYGSEEELDMNAQCVFIWRKENDNWRNIL
jgi:5'-3' exonuclease